MRVDGEGAETLYSAMTEIELSSIVLYDRQRRILLQHRTDDAPTFPGHWSFFGGHVDPGESPERAVHRETLEELSYTLKAPLLFLTQPFVHEGRSYMRHVFLEEYDGSTLILGEGQAMAWFAPAETDALLMSLHSKSAIEALGRWFEQN